MRKSVKHVQVVDLDFQRIARLTDTCVMAHFQYIRQLAKKSPVPRTIKSSAYRVTRTPRSVTIHFLMIDRKTKAEEENFIFSFVPPPRFA